jgi:hypothetical protein
MIDSVIHWGDYGEPRTAEVKERAVTGPKTVRSWHSSLSCAEINEAFVACGYIGRLPDIEPKTSSFNPQYDQGPGVQLNGR